MSVIIMQVWNGQSNNRNMMCCGNELSATPLTSLEIGLTAII